MTQLFDTKETGPKVRGIEIIVPGKPYAQPRHRAGAMLASGNALWAASRQAQNPQHLRQLLSKLVSTRVYLTGDEPVRGYKKDIRSAAYKVFCGKPWESAVRLEVLFLMPRPKSKTWKTKPNPSYPHIGRPDVDNCTKAVKDALTGVVYRDDSQVAECRSSKWVCAGGEQPKTIIRLSKIEG